LSFVLSPPVTSGKITHCWIFLAVSTISSHTQDTKNTENTEDTKKLQQPWGICFDKASKSLYFCDPHAKAIMQLPLKDGSAVTFAGFEGELDGTYNTARFDRPMCIVKYDDRNVFYVTDQQKQKICKITAEGEVSSFANTAGLKLPAGISIDPRNGDLFVLDNDGVKKITQEESVEKLLSSPEGDPVVGIAFNEVDECLYFTHNNAVKRLGKDGNVVTIAGGTSPGYSDGNGKAAQFDFPQGLAVGANGSFLLVADGGNNRVRRIKLRNTITNAILDPVEVDTVAGNGLQDSIDGELLLAGFDKPNFLCVNKDTVYVTEFTPAVRVFDVI